MAKRERVLKSGKGRVSGNGPSVEWNLPGGQAATLDPRDPPGIIRPGDGLLGPQDGVFFSKRE